MVGGWMSSRWEGGVGGWMMEGEWRDGWMVGVWGREGGKDSPLLEGD